jgi:hypothetical protein
LLNIIYIGDLIMSLIEKLNIHIDKAGEAPEGRHQRNQSHFVFPKNDGTYLVYELTRTPRSGYGDDEGVVEDEPSFTFGCGILSNDNSRNRTQFQFQLRSNDLFSRLRGSQSQRENHVTLFSIDTAYMPEGNDRAAIEKSLEALHLKGIETALDTALKDLEGV